ncbi:uncharacterized protein LOC126714683 isoform X1 [Quercus robur]|uniref:uncharacterized protein LOC126714683 isoform X1 n=1 Tax=Quercus robur TaxID=38942 RepID=UPI00216178F9|nr:uncharacterized protein LOC126714683 isoform X1 [Quercus robur]
MDGGEEWHVASLGLGSTGKRDKMMMGSREMLRFRPIAPKPVIDGSGSSYMVTERKDSVVSKGRTKRKYVRVRKNSMNGYKKMVSEEESKDGVLKTLQLLPEKAEMKDPVDPTAEKVGVGVDNDRVVVDNVEGGGGGGGGGESDLTVEMGQTRVVESWVTVESVADTCMDVRGLGSTDVERVKNLERDACPGFISDGLNRVQWVNEAYKRMVTKELEYCDGQSPEYCDCLVRLVVNNKVKLLLLPYNNNEEAFTGLVRLVHTWRNQKKCSKVVPCDVWRMDRGGFSWRLDVKAALGLGL